MNFRRVLSLGMLPLCFIWLSIIEKNLLPFILLLHIAIHEAGHIIASVICGTRPQNAGGQYIGLNISFSGELISYKKELFILLSGSAANFLVLSLSLFILPEFYEFYYLSGIGIALFNLLPLRICDGGKALECILFIILPEDPAEKIAKAVHFTFTLIFSAFAVGAQFVYGINISLLIISIYFFIELILSE